MPVTRGVASGLTKKMSPHCDAEVKIGVASGPIYEDDALHGRKPQPFVSAMAGHKNYELRLINNLHSALFDALCGNVRIWNDSNVLWKLIETL